MCSAGKVEAVLNSVADVNIAVARAARIGAVFSLRACCLMEPILMRVEVVLSFESFGRYGDGGDNAGDFKSCCEIIFLKYICRKSESFE